MGNTHAVKLITFIVYLNSSVQAYELGGQQEINLAQMFTENDFDDML